MKIDLHCHTKKTKKSDGINRNVDVTTFAKYMKDLDIKIVAITNHNLFDKKQYEEFAESVKDYTMVWPGIELDINQQPEKNGHMIVICDPNQYEKFAEIINKGIDDVDNYSITLKELWEKTKEINCIYIAHYYRKKPEINEKELIDFKNCGIEDYRIFKEPSNYRTLGVFATFNNNVIIGTDVQDWDKYKECNFSELKLPVDSFEQFLLLSKKESTIINTILNVIASLFVTLPAAYALSRRDLIGRNIVTKMMLVTMFISGGLIPGYLNVYNLGLINTRAVLILTSLTSTYNIIVSRTFFASTIPDDLLEAARLDGCGNGRFFTSIVMPLSKPVTAVIALYVGVVRWNSYFTEMIYLRDRELSPISLVLRRLLWSVEAMQKMFEQGLIEDASGVLAQLDFATIMQFCLIVISTVPMMIVYPFIQKYFAKGVMIGSVKG